MVRAYRRLRLPEQFVEHVRDSLAGLSAVVRTAYGTTAPFPVTRSVPQGRARSCLDFVVFIDPLHCMLHEHADDAITVACQEGKYTVGSRGFADDTWVVSSTVEGLVRQHHRAVRWMDANHLRFSAHKTVLVGRDAAGRCMVSHAGLAIEGHVLQPTPLDEATRYLGVLVRMDMQWEQQVSNIGSRVGQYANAIRRHRLQPDIAVEMVRQHLMPSIGYPLRSACVRDRDMARWDSTLIAAVSAAAGSVGRVMLAQAVHVITGIILPSMQEKVVKLAETVIRLNDPAAHSVLARDLYHQRGAYGHKRRSRMHRAHAIAASLGWSMEHVRRERSEFKTMTTRVSTLLKPAVDRDAVCAGHLGTWAGTMRSVTSASPTPAW